MTQPAPPPSAGGGFLLPDDENLHALLDLVDEPLMMFLSGTREEAAQEGWQLPAAVLDPQLREAWSRIWHTINDTTAAARPRRMLALDGRRDLLPLVLVPLDEPDVERLRALDAALQRAVAPDAAASGDRETLDLAELLEQLAAGWEHELRARHDLRDERPEVFLAGALHRLLAVLDTRTLPQARPLLTRLGAASADDVHLTGPEADAYRELARHFCTQLAPASPQVHSMLYLGFPDAAAH